MTGFRNAPPVGPWAARHDGLLFVHADCVLDMGVYAAARRELDAGAAAIRHLIIDCEEVDTVRNSGLAALIAIDVIARSEGFDVSVLDAPESVRGRLASWCKVVAWLE